MKNQTYKTKEYKDVIKLEGKIKKLIGKGKDDEIGKLKKQIVELIKKDLEWNDGDWGKFNDWI